jgi:glycosyltransferase involved in cell wall biosynthesis
MRILHTEASRGWGGQEIRILTEARIFLDHGHDVLLLADRQSEILAAAPKYGVPVKGIDLSKKSPAAFRAVRAVLRDWRPDVVNPHSSVDSWMVALARIGLSPRPRVVRTRHISAPVPRNPASRWTYRHGCDFVMTTGELIVEQLTGDGFLAADRIASVPTGIDTTVYAPGDRAAARRALGLPADATLIGSIATLRSWKGHSFLIDAFARFADPAARLVIVGDGPQDQALRHQAAALGLAERVLFPGRRDDVPTWLAAFDLFALASWANEGVPQAVLQALACEKPILSCPIGGIPECTAGLPSVRLVEPKSADALLAGLDAWRAAPPGPEALALGRARVLERYSLERMYRTVLGHFEG